MYRVEKSAEAFSDALALAELKSWNSAVNRLYYSAYYIISALLIKDNIETKTHSGLRIQFNLHYVKTGKITMEIGKLYSDLFDSRQKGDYGDMFDFDEETVIGLIEPVRDLIKTVRDFIDQE